MNYTYQYLPWRGINPETFAFYHSKTKVDDEGKPISIGFKYPDGWFKVRELSKKAFHTQGDIKPGLFGRNLYDHGSHKCVVITEGEADALAFWQVTRVPAVSVRSASTALADCTADYSWLQSFERVYLALDGDAPGRQATADVARLLDRERTYHVRFTRHKDALAYVEAGEQTELMNLWERSKKYLPETLISSLSEFQAILEREPPKGVPYPFDKLNEATYGIRTGETVLVTAAEGVGKTEFLHAIEHSILTKTDWKIGAIFLEETTRRHLESLASIELQRPCHLPDSGCSHDQIVGAVNKVLGMDDRLFLDTTFGSFSTSDLNDQIRFLVSGCGVRCIMLDHVSMAVSGSERTEDERKALDHFFTTQEMMVKELDYSLIVVSHVNDFGQTRGSRWGSKVADVRIHLDRDLDNGSNIVNISIKDKNRFGGKTGFIGSYIFDPLTRQYKEVANDNPDRKSNPGWPGQITGQDSQGSQDAGQALVS